MKDVIYGGEGNDTLKFSGAGWNGNILSSSAVLDSIEFIDVGGRSLFVEGGGSYDFSGLTLINTTGNIHVTGSLGARVDGNDQNNLITGDIYAADGDDTFHGGGGNDTLSGLHGNDFIGGDAGGDQILGGIGNDTLYGEIGNDVISGEEGNDYMLGEASHDTLNGGAGND